MGKKLSKEEIVAFSEKTSFDKNELQQRFKEFTKSCNVGIMNREEWIREARQYYGFNPELSNILFNLYDLEGDGMINFEEYIITMSICLKGTLEEKLELAFRLFDVNGDGVVTREEMLTVLKAIYEPLNLVSSSAQIQPGMGGVRLDTIPEDQRSAEKRTEYLFQLMDQNNDGKIELDDFVSGAKNDLQICNAITELFRT